MILSPSTIPHALRSPNATVPIALRAEFYKPELTRVNRSAPRVGSFGCWTGVACPPLVMMGGATNALWAIANVGMSPITGSSPHKPSSG